MSSAGEMRLLFCEKFGRDPACVWAAPGRVNLIGDHTDYNDGYVLPIAIEQRTTVALGARDDRVVNGWSVQYGDAAPMSLDALQRPATGSWLAYAAGVAWALREDGYPVSGFDLLVDSDVPAGAGLSSSAALECATGSALCDLAAITVEPLKLAKAAQRGEHEIVGAPVGLMDQAISLLGTSSHALFLDCRSLTTRYVPFDLDSSELALLVVDTRVKHANVGRGYAERRAACEQAAAILGQPSLRDATLDDVERIGDEVLARRMRHVVTENERVLAAVRALDAGNWPELGRLFSASHASLRDDFEVSCAELDRAVAAALEAGALGARMTGAGFGGSAIALVPVQRAEVISDVIAKSFADAGFAAPHIFPVHPSSGARQVAA